MKTTFDLNTMMYMFLKSLNMSITGDIYKDERPDGSMREDIVVNTIDLTTDYAPQIATSNVNIHVPDLDLTIDGRPQKKEDMERLGSLTKTVMDGIRGHHFEHCGTILQSQVVLKDEDAIGQHYSNIRIGWYLHEN